MKTKINVKRFLLATFFVMLINMVIGNVLYMNPLVSGIYAEFSGHMSVKPMEDFGGTANWVLLTFGFGVLLNLFFIAVFVFVHDAIPGNAVIKGFLFGIIIAIIKAVPEAFNQFMIFKYPNILIIVQLVNTTVGITLFGIYLSLVFTKLKVLAPKKATIQ